MIRLRKLNLISYLFFALMVVVLLVSVSSVGAQSYYNHIQNPSFLANTNYVEDGSFESGVYNSGLTYGNWSGDAVFSLSAEHSGIYGLFVDTDDYAWYNLTSDYYVLGADIEVFTLYARNTYTNVNLHVWIYYSDDSSTDVSIPTTTSWAKFDIAGDVVDAKTVVAFKIIQSSAWEEYVDVVNMIVDDGEGQDSISMNTSPWCIGGTYGYNFGHLNTVTGRLDTSSVQLSGYDSYLLIQDIGYVDSDYVQYVNCYVLGADVADGDGITCSIVYSDRSTSENTKYVTGDGSSWEELNFGQSFVRSDRYIVQIRFNLESDDGTAVAIFMDDVGLWVSYPYGFSRFTFALSPSPIVKGEFDFDAYQGVSYTFFGYVYNVTSDALDENGTVTITDDNGVRSRSLVNGQFNYTMEARSFVGGAYRMESIGVVISIPDASEIISVTISAYWYRTGVSGGDDSYSGAFSWVSPLGDFFVVFAVIGLPAMVFGAVTKSPMGMVAGLVLGASAGFGAGILDFWVLLLVSVAMVVMFLVSWRAR